MAHFGMPYKPRFLKERQEEAIREGLPPSVLIREQGPVDGFQNEKGHIPTEKKIALIEALSHAGFRVIATISLVSPKWLPHMADALEVWKGLRKRPGVEYTALIPNEKGLERALQCEGLKRGYVPLSASEAQNMRNLNKSIAQSLAELPSLLEKAKQADITLEATISTSFGCPVEGDVPFERVEEIVRRLWEMGFRMVTLGDTTGMANPLQVRRLLRFLKEKGPDVLYALHFHDTRGSGLANILAALYEGIYIFDSSFGGLGGCPFAPGASGNVVTEDLVCMLEEMRIGTGIDLAKLIECSRRAEEILGRPLPGHVLKAGPVKH